MKHEEIQTAVFKIRGWWAGLVISVCLGAGAAHGFAQERIPESRWDSPPERKEPNHVFRDRSKVTTTKHEDTLAIMTEPTLESCCFEKNEIVGGFSLTREDSEPEDFNTHGFQSSYTRYLNASVGFTADFSANFRDREGVSLTKTSYAGGLTVLPFPGANGDDRVRVFGRALFGVAHFKADTGNASFTDNAFTAKVGAGVDININKHFFVRPAEVDYAPTRFGGVWQHNIQFNTGMGLRF